MQVRALPSSDHGIAVRDHRVATPGVRATSGHRVAPSEGPERATAVRASGLEMPRPSVLALYGVAALAPLPFGANGPLPLAAIGCVLAVGLAFAPLARLRAPHLGLLACTGILACTIVAAVAMQMASGMSGDPAWTEAARLLGTTLPASPSVVRGQPLFAVGHLMCCLGALALGLLVGTDRTRARRVVDVVAWSSLGYAVLGIVNVIADPSLVMWRERDDYVGAVLGPFINRNTAAIYFGCGAAVWAALLTDTLPGGAWPSGTALRAMWRVLAVRAAGTITCLAAAVGTNSRSGTLLTLAGLGFVGAVRYREEIARVSGRIQAAVLAGAVTVSLVTAYAGVTGQRFQSLGFADEGRAAVYRAVLSQIADHPWLGTGLGTFPWIYPSYRSVAPGMRNVWDKAHSTPLELAAELGLPLATLIILCVCVAVAILLRGALVRRRDRAVPLAAAAALTIAAAHSCVDFSLQIPGLAVVVMALAGTGLAQSFASQPHSALVTDGAFGCQPRDPRQAARQREDATAFIDPRPPGGAARAPDPPARRSGRRQGWTG